MKRRSRFVSGVQQQLLASKIQTEYKGVAGAVCDVVQLQPHNAAAAAAVPAS